MEESQLYEKVGRLSLALEEKEAALVTAIGVVAALKKGEITIDQVLLTPGGFQVLPPNAEKVTPFPQTG